MILPSWLGSEKFGKGLPAESIRESFLDCWFEFDSNSNGNGMTGGRLSLHFDWHLRRWLHLLHPLFHLLRRDIFLVSRNPPEMTKWILNKSGTVAIELVLDGLEYLRARSYGPLHYLIHIFDV